MAVNGWCASGRVVHYKVAMPRFSYPEFSVRGAGLIEPFVSFMFQENGYILFYRQLMVFVLK